MLKYTLLLCAIVAVTICDERKHKYVDPFTILDRHISHTLAHHYLWPWSQLVRAAAAFDAEDYLQDPQIVSTPTEFQVNMNVKRFKPNELKVKVKNRNIIIEGKHKVRNENVPFMDNHFIQRFALPSGSKQEEVTAVLKANGILSVSVPRHEPPPPPPEREVPIEVLVPEETTKKPEIETVTEKQSERETTTQKNIEKEITTEKQIEYVVSSTSVPLEQLDLVDTTTHVGKIRKKELKDTAKTSKDNEVTKGIDENGLDFALIEGE